MDSKKLVYLVSLIIGAVLLYYLWPLFFVLILVMVGIGIWLSYRSKKLFKDVQDNYRETSFYEEKTLSSPDVIDAEYKEETLE